MYKTLIAEIGRLIKSALPYAIVDNGTNPDGSVRPLNLFQSLTSYRTVQSAIDAGATRIEVKRGLYPSFATTSAQSGITIRGSGVSITVFDGGTTAPAVKILSSNCYLSDFTAKTTAGGGQPNAAVQVGDASNNVSSNTFENIYIPQSDYFGFGVVRGSSNMFRSCTATSCDSSGFSFDASSGSSNGNIATQCVSTSNGGYGVYIDHGTGNAVVACYVGSNTSGGIFVANATQTGSVIVGNTIASNTSFSVNLYSGGTGQNCVVGNIFETTNITNNNSSSTVASNEVY